MKTTDSYLETLRMLNKRFIHNFVTNDGASPDAILHPDFRTQWPPISLRTPI